MTLLDLASIASVISGIAVLISLIYLSFQLRHNTTSLRRAEANATQDQASAIRNSLINSREVAHLWVEGQKGDSVLDEADEVRFSAMVGERFWFYRHQWDREQHGILAKGVWERNSPVLIRTLTTKRGAHWWTLNKSTVPPEFMRDLDARIGAEQTRSVR